MEVQAYEERLRKDRRFARQAVDDHLGRPIYATLKTLARKLAEVGIVYAITGELAVGEHGLDRTTGAVELLVTKQGLERFRRMSKAWDYAPAFPGARRTFCTAGIQIAFVTADDWPRDAKSERVAFPDPAADSVEIEGLRVIAQVPLVA